MADLIIAQLYRGPLGVHLDSCIWAKGWPGFYAYQQVVSNFFSEGFWDNIWMFQNPTKTPGSKQPCNFLKDIGLDATNSASSSAIWVENFAHVDANSNEMNRNLRWVQNGDCPNKKSSTSFMFFHRCSMANKKDSWRKWSPCVHGDR